MPLAETFFFCYRHTSGKGRGSFQPPRQKEIVGDNQCLFHDFAVGESIDIDSIVLVVEAVKQAAVEKRNGAISQIDKQLRILKIRLVTHEFVVVVVAAAVSEMPL